MKLGYPAALTDFTFKMPPAAYYESPQAPVYKGDVSIIADIIGTGTVQVTET